ncbi:MAG: hypothetical protein AAB154_00565 [Candidatus Binatota bacterium]
MSAPHRELIDRILFILFGSWLFILAQECAAQQPVDLKSSNPDPTEDILDQAKYLNYIMVHQDGYPIGRNLKPVGNKDNDDFRSKYVGKILSDIDEYARETWTNQHKKPQILIFVHGGSNPYEAGLRKVEDLSGKDGRSAGSSYYPIFILWNSDLMSSVRDNLVKIRGAEVTNTAWGWLTSPFVAAGQFASSLFDVVPMMWPLVRATWPSCTGAQSWWEYPVSCGSFVITVPTRAFITSPLIELFGAPAWATVNRRARLILAPKLELNPYAREGALFTFMQELNARISTQDGNTKWKWKNSNDTNDHIPIEITLVGHSMGTIVSDEILRAFPKIPFERIVYLASASSVRDVDTAVLPYLDGNKKTKFWAFTLSRANEARTGMRIVDLLERGSLLVWIDHLFEDVKTKGQLRFGICENLTQSKSGFVEQREEPYKGRLTVVRFEGKENEPTTHWEFDEGKIFKKILDRVYGQDVLPIPDCR